MDEESKQKPKETNSIRASSTLLDVQVLKENKLLHDICLFALAGRANTEMLLKWCPFIYLCHRAQNLSGVTGITYLCFTGEI